MTIERVVDFSKPSKAHRRLTVRLPFGEVTLALEANPPSMTAWFASTVGPDDPPITDRTHDFMHVAVAAEKPPERAPDPAFGKLPADLTNTYAVLRRDRFVGTAADRVVHIRGGFGCKDISHKIYGSIVSTGEDFELRGTDLAGTPTAALLAEAHAAGKASAAAAERHELLCARLRELAAKTPPFVERTAPVTIDYAKGTAVVGATINLQLPKV